MNIKKILFTFLILMILSVTAVSAADSDNINATDSIEPAQAIEPVKTVEHDNTLEPVSKNKPVNLSNIKATSTYPGTFDDLQLEIYNAEYGSIIVLTRDYYGQYGSRIHLNKDITIDGQGHTINCVGEERCSAFYSTTGNIVLKNILIINGHNDYNDKGGAIHIEGSAKYTLENCKFENNWANDQGGAIYNDGDVLTIKNCIFDGNTAESGGAIYSTKDVIIDGSTFTNNNADMVGGAIGAEENAKINNCTFKNNYAKNSGGAVCTSTLTIEGNQSTFEGNSVNDYGGAIYTNSFTDPVSHVSFINNMAHAGDGGAVYIDKENWIPFTDCVFINNKATNRGGAIYINSITSHLILTNNIFNGNSAADEGHTVFNCGYYDLISDNQWYIIPTTSNYQLVKWKQSSPNIQYTDSNPVPIFPGTFDDLQIEINNAEDGSVLVLTRDYNGQYGLRIHLDKDLTIDGQGHTLDCLGKGGCIAFFSTTGNIVLKNIRIVGGHNDLDGKGGAIHIEGSAKYTLENCEFAINWAEDYGGTIYNDGETLTIKNCTFDANTADDESGGAIYSTKDVIIDDSTFTNNHAKESGGAIYCKGTVSVNMNQGTRPYNSFFDYNKVIKWNGGAIYASKIYLKNALLQDNSAFCDGGAVYSTAYFNATNCLFELNTVEYSGGAIYVETTYNMDNNTYIKGCIFKSNTATKSSGAVEAHSDVFIDNCTFENNWAGSEAGALSAQTVYININQAENESYNTYFIGNSVSNSEGRPNRGGAIYIDNGGRIVNTYFKDNNAKVDGGAIYVEKSLYDHTYSNKINIDHCLFEDNSATGGAYQCYGGAICSESDVYIHNSTFKDNYADDYGGAIYAKDVNINHDRECETTDTFFINNKAKDNDGGAIYAENDVFTRNVAFISNTAYVDGGAIYAKNNVETRCCIFESNKATGAPSTRCYGGAIRAGENAKINNCTFKNNYADNRGGAVHASTVTLEGGPSRFEGNSANDYGGAIYTETFTNDVSHATFINNRAEDGGAVYINKENWITFTDCVFMNNRASNKGGAIYMDSKYSHLTIKNNVFINNIADNGGHTVFNYGYYDAISDNYWTINPTDYNNQLVEWKALSSNIQHTDSNPVRFTMEIIGSCSANLTSGVKMSFVHQDGTPATLPMIAEYFSMSGVEGIEIGDKEISSDDITIWFTPTAAGTYELPAYILGMTGIMTINIIDGGAIIPEPLPEQDIMRTDIPKPVIPKTITTNC